MSIDSDLLPSREAVTSLSSGPILSAAGEDVEA